MSNNEIQGGLHKSVINWYPGHMAKTKRELKENIKLVDVVYEVIDARMPISSKIIDIDEIIKDKPKILIVTKYDLCDKAITDNILNNYMKKGYIVICCNLIKNIGISKIIEETKKISKGINKERIVKGLKERKMRVLVIGIPNVGKSTLINHLVGKNVTQVGNKPGITKNISWIRINNDIELMDSPGILWPKLDNQEHAYNLAAFSSIKDEVINKEDLAIYILNKLIKLYPDYLKKRYNINLINIDKIFDNIATSKSMYEKGGIISYEKVYNTIINDLRNGILGPVTFD